VGCATWTGTPLTPLLEQIAGPETVDVVFTGADHGLDRGVEQDYQRALPVTEAMRDEVLLAYEMNGQPLPPQHGFPLRLVVPGWYGMAHVKWLRAITVLDHPFEGFQNSKSYRFKRDLDDPGTPVTRMRPRALMVPPGFPDFMTRTRIVTAGEVELTGRTWSGLAPVVRVEVSADDGTTWQDAAVAPPSESYAWQGWRCTWTATPGRCVLRVRATDATGATQPLDPPWNAQGVANNVAQRVEVLVRS
jgi:sulfane dehydrogenase subunit SoxC